MKTDEKQPSTAGRFEDLVRAGISISAERGLDAVLQTIADAARDVIKAQYAAIGILDVSGTGLSRFVERRNTGTIASPISASLQFI